MTTAPESNLRGRFRFAAGTGDWWLGRTAGHFSGDVPRIDISEAYFREIVEASGLTIVKRIGFWLGQYVFVVGRPGGPGLA